MGGITRTGLKGGWENGSSGGCGSSGSCGNSRGCENSGGCAGTCSRRRAPCGHGGWAGFVVFVVHLGVGVDTSTPRRTRVSVELVRLELKVKTHFEKKNQPSLLVNGDGRVGYWS